MSYPAGSCRGGEGRPAVLDSLSLVPHMSVQINPPSVVTLSVLRSSLRVHITVVGMPE